MMVAWHWWSRWGNIILGSRLHQRVLQPTTTRGTATVTGATQTEGTPRHDHKATEQSPSCQFAKADAWHESDKCPALPTQFTPWYDMIPVYINALHAWALKILRLVKRYAVWKTTPEYCGEWQHRMWLDRHYYNSPRMFLNEGKSFIVNLNVMSDKTKHTCDVCVYLSVEEGCV